MMCAAALGLVHALCGGAAADELNMTYRLLWPLLLATSLLGVVACSDDKPQRPQPTSPDQGGAALDMRLPVADMPKDQAKDLSSPVDMRLPLDMKVDQPPDMTALEDMALDMPRDMSEMGAPAPFRRFFLSFTVWPYDATVAAIQDTYVKIKQEGDTITHHLQGGIPWQDALDGELAYHPSIESDLCGRLQLTYPQSNITPDASGRCFAPSLATRRPIYLALDSLDQTRQQQAGYWDANESEPLAQHAPWDTYEFDDVRVSDAYASFALAMIDRFKPALLNIGTESSELLLHDEQRYNKYVIFIERVAQKLKAQHPQLPLLISVALKSPDSAEALKMKALLPSLIQHIDVVGVSVYPYAFFDPRVSDPAQLPARWLSQVNDYTAGRPIAITETGWIAQTLNVPTYGLNVAADEQTQRAFVQQLFDECQQLQCVLINWFTVADYDRLWQFIGQDPVSHLWRDTGLYDDALIARPALLLWRQWLARDVMLRP